jgi:hypothetical protein
MENLEIITRASFTHDTAMLNDFAWELSLRVFAIAIGLLGIVWGVSELPALREESISEKVAARILAGEIYKPEILLKQVALLESTYEPESCRPLKVRSWAVIRLRIAEISDVPTLPAAPDRTESAVDAVSKSLACSPSDPFFWLALYSLEPGAPSDYLAASYRLGPNEGWIALKRNPVAFANFDDLPKHLRDILVQEFLKILQMNAIDDAVKIFVGPAWDKRDLILSQMEQVPLWQRLQFRSALTRAGYDVFIPGTRAL